MTIEDLEEKFPIGSMIAVEWKSITDIENPNRKWYGIVKGYKDNVTIDYNGKVHEIRIDCSIVVLADNKVETDHACYYYPTSSNTIRFANKEERAKLGSLTSIYRKAFVKHYYTFASNTILRNIIDCFFTHRAFYDFVCEYSQSAEMVKNAFNDWAISKIADEVTIEDLSAECYMDLTDEEYSYLYPFKHSHLINNEND